jgi:glycosyltransferase involved in cell wall biosynthesis
MGYRTYYLSREWVRKGHNVLVLASSYSHIRTEQPNVIGSKSIEVFDGVSFCWYKSPKYIGNGIRRVGNILSFIWSIYRDRKDIANNFKPDIVIASSTYPMDIWPARRIAKENGAKLIFEVHDLWPLSPIELGGMSLWNPFIIWTQLAENYAYKHADEVVSILPKTKPHMVSHGMAPKKFHHIPNGVTLEDWDTESTLPINVSIALENIRQNKNIIVGYAGTYGLANALDALLDAAKLFSMHAELILVGTGPETEHLLARIKDEKIDNVTMMPAIPKSSIPAFLDAIDIAYIGLLPEPLFRFGISPNKLMDYMMAAKPVVMAIAAGNDPVSESRCGITVEPNNPQAIADAVVSISKESERERVEMGQRGKNYIIGKHTYSRLADNFIKLMI